MEVRPVFTTGHPVQAAAACELLRAHGIKCDVVETGFEHVSYGSPSAGRTRYAVVVAESDEERATSALKAQSAP